MAVLGKRKSREELSVSEEDAAAIFRRHFEAQFAPLPGTKTKTSKTAPSNQDEDDDSDDDSDDLDEVEEGSQDDEEEDEDEWGGVSEEEEDEAATTIEVVDHSSAQPPTPTTMSKRELKAFMSSRPPDQTTFETQTSATTKTSSSSSLPEDAPSLLAQDLELRRLLAESHLLRPALTSSGIAVNPKSFASGRTRQKATDLRVQALGSSISIHKQEKMPMNMRKGIVATASAREAKRRKEAKENGIILEREASKKPRRGKGRDLGVDRPGVGRLKGAELRLNDRDVRKIESGRDVFGRRGRK
ncbi:hypothetical protein BGZ63DRAFT_420221 [Mariannaea sp. PMI_226]|nr:hypothetical protein BGZ63DRAFT_420221 [Mariannaea sp. PMI_226]